MKIIHHIALWVEEDEQREFLNAGIPLEIGHVSFRIAEDDLRWNNVKQLMDRFNMGDMTFTEFSSSELNSARYLALGSTWHAGYPLPDGDNGYLEKTYDITNYCDQCGMGAIQNSSFRIRNAPNWGKKSIFQLNWIFDEYFVKREIWESIFHPLGIQCKSVQINRKKDADTLVQLDVSHRVDLDMTGYEYSTCPQCNRKKYHHVTRGFYPKPINATDDMVMFKSNQYFGDGACADAAVFVTAELYRELQHAKIKGVEFKPCFL